VRAGALRDAAARRQAADGAEPGAAG